MASGSRSIWLIILLPLVGFAYSGIQLWRYRYDLKQHNEATAEREQRYRAYLEQKTDEIIELAKRQQRIQHSENPATPNVLKRIEAHAHLWERLPDHDDFLAVRVGNGDLPLSAEIELPERMLDDDPLLALAAQLREKYGRVPGLPILANLRTLGTVGIQGRDASSALQAAFTILASLAAHHSPDVLQLYLISHRPDAERHWRWFRWLPHVSIIQGKADDIPRISFDPDADDAVLSPLTRILRHHLEKPRYDDYRRERTAHRLIIFDQLYSTQQFELVDMLLAYRPNRDGNVSQTSAIFIDYLPRSIAGSVNALIDVQNGAVEYRELWQADAHQRVIRGQSELTSLETIDKLARRLAPLRTESSYRASGGNLPSSVRLVELLGAVQPPDVDLATLYSDTYDSRRVMSFPIGLNTDLKPQIVTLREDSQGGLGHHAMLAGGIGKGKSVTLQSIVLALAASNSPAHLNFVLADFKGGASELGRLRTLPHVVGFVTDLDEAYVERFRLALEGEVLRRKQILDDTPRTFGRQIPNIYEYNRAVAPEEIMPHLVVVIDEFAKAIRINAHFKKTVDNDITAQGRALGIHLILSTQKAQDFEGIRLNIEVRMSMQVQTTEDSRVIFGRDDAATKLTRAGQALLQVGNNRVFEMFQVARTDIPYVPEGAGNIDLVDDFTIRQIAPNGRRHTLYKHRPQMQITDHASRLSEAEVLVRHIADYCQTRYAPTRTICLPPLPPAESMPVFDLLQKQHPAVFCPWQRQSGWDTAQKSEHYRLQAPLGMLDLPSQQLQQPYILNLNERDGNLLIVGPTGSGKSLLLQTLVLAFASTHAPDDLAFYFWGQGPAFVTLAELPHSPAFIQPAETERTQRLLGFLEKEMARRRALLGELRAGNMEALRRARPDLPLPAVVIILDDIGSLTANDFDRIQAIENLLSQARQVDMHFIVSTATINSIPTRLRGHLRTRIALGANNPFEIFTMRGAQLPEMIGRGYVEADQALIECQFAAPATLPGLPPGSQKASANLQELVRDMAAQWTWTTAQPPLSGIQILPKYIELRALWAAAYAQPTLQNQPTAPFGLDYELETAVIELTQLEPYHLIVGQPKSGKSTLLASLTLAAAANLPPDQLEIFLFSAKRPDPLRELATLPNVKYANNEADANELLSRLLPELNARAVEQANLKDKNMTQTADLRLWLPIHTLILVDDLARFGKSTEFNSLLDQCIAFYDKGMPIHLILADTASNINQMRQQAYNVQYLKAATTFGAGMALSAESTDLMLLNLIGKVPKQAASQVGQGRGFWTHNSQTRLVQFATAVPENATGASLSRALRLVVSEIVSAMTPDER